MCVGSRPVAIVVFCPGCKVRLTVSDDRAGDAIDCPNCDLRIRIPGALPAPAPQPAPPLPPPLPTRDPWPPPLPTLPPQSTSMTRVVIVPVPVPLERDEEERRPRRRRRRRPRCPFCGSRARPYWQSQISTGGWVTFAL